MSARIRNNGTVLLLVALLTLGCGGYPEVSPKTNELAMALYGACNRKSEDSLTKASELIDQAHQANEINSSEQKWLQQIVEKAESGDWEEAMLEAREIMDDQAGR